jgi:hypothetical protein
METVGAEVDRSYVAGLLGIFGGKVKHEDYSLLAAGLIMRNFGEITMTDFLSFLRAIKKATSEVVAFGQSARVN